MLMDSAWQESKAGLAKVMQHAKDNYWHLSLVKHRASPFSRRNHPEALEVSNYIFLLALLAPPKMATVGGRDLTATS